MGLLLLVVLLGIALLLIVGELVAVRALVIDGELVLHDALVALEIAVLAEDDLVREFDRLAAVVRGLGVLQEREPKKQGKFSETGPHETELTSGQKDSTSVVMHL